MSATDLDSSVGYETELKGLNSGINPFEIGFNGNFLKQVVSSVEGDTFVLQMTQPNRPGVIREGKRLMLLMPLMLGQY